MEGKKVPVYGTGENVRDWIHVEDHVKGVQAVIEKGVIGETYCLGGNAEMRNIDIAHLILKEFGMDDTAIEYVEDRKGHDQRYAINFSKAKNELNWQPEHSFSKGLAQTINWYKENEKWWKALKARVPNII